MLLANSLYNKYKNVRLTFDTMHHRSADASGFQFFIEDFHLGINISNLFLILMLNFKQLKTFYTGVYPLEKVKQALFPKLNEEMGMKLKKIRRVIDN